jgi:hypothetical protein
MNEKPTVSRGEYTWHPIVSLSALIRELQGSLKPRKDPANRDFYASFMRYEQRLKSVAPRIIEMMDQGATQKTMSKELGIPKSTLSGYIKDIKESRTDKWHIQKVS